MANPEHLKFTALVTGRFGRAIIRGLNLTRAIGQEIVRAGISAAL